jgi:Transglycosylase-like domain
MVVALTIWLTAGDGMGIRDSRDSAPYSTGIHVLPPLYRRARRRTRSRRLLAAVIVGAAFLAISCFPNGPGGSSSPHHNDPFLTCVRQRESGNRYNIDSPGGQYHGAYQFLQATWDDTARHIGVNNLVGVDPHLASPTTQDDMAWALYQWQGEQPWAGVGC